jgi:hypothetical protein
MGRFKTALVFASTVAFSTLAWADEEESSMGMDSEVPAYDESMAPPDVDVEDPGIGGSDPSAPMDDPVEDPEVNITPPPATESTQPIVVVQQDDPEQDQKERNNRFIDRFKFGVGGGVEGYTGVLNDRVNAGPTWGVNMATQPIRGFGVELGYTGAVNEVNGDLATAPDHLTNGADIVRNGGHAAVTFALPTPWIQPYALGGVGIDYYNVRGTNPGIVFQDDTSGRVPLGLGIKGHAGNFSADLRAQYNVLFDQQFAEAVPGENDGGGYSGMLTLGARF